MVRMIADERGVIGFHEAEWPIVDGEAQDRHIVGIHYAVRESNRLPGGDEARRARHNFAVPERVAVRLPCQMRKMFFDHVIGEPAHEVGPSAVVEIFEMTETHM